MARENEIILRYGSRAALDAVAAANGLLKGEPFLIDDENRIGVALSISTYQTFLKSGEGGGGGGLKGTATLTLPDAAGTFEWEETVVATGVTSADTVFVFLAAALDDDENCPEMLDLITFRADADTDSLTITATFSEATSGPIKIVWKVL